VFHRVIKDFAIQGGGYDPSGTYHESPYGPIDLEIHPDVRHVDGAISMARTSDPNSATSQFFICDGTQPHLDGEYAAFGKILIGLDVLRDIASVETTTKHGMQDWPIEEAIINYIEIIQ
jgi:cyclophilin family peptidyl-prolyl cis-trans isomerase